MTLLISINQRQISVVLKEGKKEMDKIKWQDENRISKTLLSQIDKLLKRNKIELRDLEKIETQFNEAGYTTKRIAKAVAKTVNYCLAT